MIAVLVALLAMGQSAQPAQPVRAVITVVDQMGGVIPNAKVTIGTAEAVTDERQGRGDGDRTGAGQTVDHRRNSPASRRARLKDMTFKAGDNKHVVVLPIQGLQDSVTVSRDAREAASDRRSTFGTAMTREQIEALSDDPDEMAQQLQDIAGGNAVIRVDSFEGSRLPPKSAIKAIHITRDAFAAENHFAGGLFIDIITQPGIGPLRTNMNMSLRDGSMSGTPPVEFADQQAKGPEQIQRYGGGLSGSLIKQKASFSINVNGGTSYDTPYFYYYTPDGVAGERPGAAPAARQRVRVRHVRLRDYARPDAARPLQPGPVHQQEPRRRRLGPVSNAAIRPRIATTRSGSRRPGRSAAASSSIRAPRSTRRSPSRSRSSSSRRSGSSTASPAAASSAAAASTRRT